MKAKISLAALFLFSLSSLMFNFNEEDIAVKALPGDENSIECPYLGTPECPLTSDYSGNASSKPESTDLNDCPLAGTPDCPLLPDCCKNK